MYSSDRPAGAPSRRWSSNYDCNLLCKPVCRVGDAHRWQTVQPRCSSSDGARRADPRAPPTADAIRSRAAPRFRHTDHRREERSGADRERQQPGRQCVRAEKNGARAGRPRIRRARCMRRPAAWKSSGTTSRAELRQHLLHGAVLRADRQHHHEDDAGERGGAQIDCGADHDRHPAKATVGWTSEHPRRGCREPGTDFVVSCRLA